ncbi:PAS domain-containing protein [Mucilaginibacter ginsenosidivorax]|uniref:PAS domain S-box protein n=1 Tax=Mucilaginibacter ginsenosidivorax TaxID=862126 RepID=A0A5B8VZR4_9SPHI|nr:PAS domain S-box protein [Mucilaginibacter ginsenosidivorax]QEC77137.1 PAS domain S-box protein [Mucilaginibacter ginsenosidivorax]
MRVPFTPELLGNLIEKGYSYLLVNINSQLTDEAVTITMMPVKQKPALNNLPDGYETFYKITREPMQLACGVDSSNIFIEYQTIDNTITQDELFDDRYFRMSEDFFRQVLESLEDYAVITTDTNGDINSWNTGAEKVLGYKEPEILGKCADVFFTPEDVAAGVPEQELKTALKEGRAIDERYHMRKDGTRFWGSGLVFPLHDDQHRHRGYTKIMRNLREREQAQEQKVPE